MEEDQAWPPGAKPSGRRHLQNPYADPRQNPYADPRPVEPERAEPERAEPEQAEPEQADPERTVRVGPRRTRKPAAGTSWPAQDQEGPAWKPRPTSEESFWAEDEPEEDEEEEERPWTGSVPPSGRFYRAPADPGIVARGRGHWLRRGAVALALLVAAGLVAGGTVFALNADPPPPPPSTLTDQATGVSLPLPAGWVRESVTPVTGFTSAARMGLGALVLVRPLAKMPSDPAQAITDAARLYGKLILNADDMITVENRSITLGAYTGFTRSLRAEYEEVVNQPVYLRVMMLTRGGRGVMVIGVLQPDETSRRQALNTLMGGLR